MRCHQYVGLTKEAEKFLEENVERVPATTCPKCGEVISTTPNVIATDFQDAFYGDGPTMNTYKLKDGRVAKEILQAQPWSSGPMSFLCLEIEGKKLFQWKEDATLAPNAEYDYEKGTFVFVSVFDEDEEE